MSKTITKSHLTPENEMTSSSTVPRRVLAALGLALAAAVASPSWAGSWKQANHDARRSSFNPAETVLSPANVKHLLPRWRVTRPYRQSQGGFAVHANGSIVLCEGAQLVTRSPVDGKTIGRSADLPNSCGSPTLGGGSVFLVPAVIEEGFDVAAIDAQSGAVSWLTTVQESGYVSDPVYSDGMVYATQKVYSPAATFVSAFDAKSGAPTWRSELGDFGFKPIVAVAHERLFATSAGGANTGDEVAAFDKRSGQPLWRTSIASGDVEATSLLVAGGFVIAGAARLSGGFEIVALDPATGARRWAQTFTQDRVGAPELAAGDGLLIVQVKGRVLALALNTGEQRWEQGIECKSEAGPVLANGVVYVPTCESFHAYVSTVDARNGQIIAQTARSAVQTHDIVALAVVNGQLLVMFEGITDGGLDLIAFGLPR